MQLTSGRHRIPLRHAQLQLRVPIVQGGHRGRTPEQERSAAAATGHLDAGKVRTLQVQPQRHRRADQAVRRDPDRGLAGENL